MLCPCLLPITVHSSPRESYAPIPTFYVSLFGFTGHPAVVLYGPPPRPHRRSVAQGGAGGLETRSANGGGGVISPPAPACYRMLFRSDGQVVIDRTQCAGQDTSALVPGAWSCTETSITLPMRPFNQYGIPGNQRLEELSATTLRFSYRGGPDKIEETWVCE